VKRAYDELTANQRAQVVSALVMIGLGIVIALTMLLLTCCTDDAPPPLPSCASLGCPGPTLLCSIEGQCTCHEQSCRVVPIDAGANPGPIHRPDAVEDAP